MEGVASSGLARLAPETRKLIYLYDDNKGPSRASPARVLQDCRTFRLDGWHTRPWRTQRPEASRRPSGAAVTTSLRSSRQDRHRFGSDAASARLTPTPPDAPSRRQRALAGRGRDSSSPKRLSQSSANVRARRAAEREWSLVERYAGRRQASVAVTMRATARRRESHLPAFADANRSRAPGERRGFNALARTADARGGSADLGPSTNTDIRTAELPSAPTGAHVPFGVREHGNGAGHGIA